MRQPRTRRRKTLWAFRLYPELYRGETESPHATERGTRAEVSQRYGLSHLPQSAQFWAL